ncbi:hypothetical protein RND71_041389 [Anisodus tanguticus]|uniref:Uncharacterized protein n=1 Tax=Anisodus tanguticus TaxID=243964 RepID=A0AAE1QXA3_9SOLA|nr:hypothetical protein RND71_041389 [Anisodus tanguticus]
MDVGRHLVEDREAAPCGYDKREDAEDEVVGGGDETEGDGGKVSKTKDASPCKHRSAPSRA